MEMLPPAPSVVVDCPLADEEEEDDQSVTSTALGIESSATSFTAPRHVLLELDDEGDLQTIHDDVDGDARTTSSRFWGVRWDRRNRTRPWRTPTSSPDRRRRS